MAKMIGGERYPAALDPERVGAYEASVFAGGGYVWDAVLEYRVWCHPTDGSDDYFRAFRTYEDALEYAKSAPQSEEPLALVLQREHIDEPEPGDYRHVREKRITEWPIEFLDRPPRNEKTLARFFASNAPANRLDIIRGLADWPEER